MTRGRPRHGNDQPHVEQKNWSHVRLLLGYQRIDDPDLIPKINELYRAWGLFNNFFCTNLKLIEKTKVGSRYKKKYDDPKTPYQRLMESEHVNEAQKTHLTESYCNLNPFKLKKQGQSSYLCIDARQNVPDSGPHGEETENRVCGGGVPHHESRGPRRQSVQGQAGL